MEEGGPSVAAKRIVRAKSPPLGGILRMIGKLSTDSIDGDLDLPHKRE